MKGGKGVGGATVNAPYRSPLASMILPKTNEKLPD